jgi:hypothetical protein
MDPIKVLSGGYDSGYTIESDDHCWLVKHNGKPMIWVFKELREELIKLGEPK